MKIPGVQRDVEHNTRKNIQHHLIQYVSEASPLSSSPTSCRQPSCSKPTHRRFRKGVWPRAARTRSRAPTRPFAYVCASYWGMLKNLRRGQSRQRGKVLQCVSTGARAWVRSFSRAPVADCDPGPHPGARLVCACNQAQEHLAGYVVREPSCVLLYRAFRMSWGWRSPPNLRLPTLPRPALSPLHARAPDSPCASSRRLHTVCGTTANLARARARIFAAGAPEGLGRVCAHSSASVRVRARASAVACAPASTRLLSRLRAEEGNPFTANLQSAPPS